MYCYVPEGKLGAGYNLILLYLKALHACTNDVHQSACAVYFNIQEFCIWLVECAYLPIYSCSCDNGPIFL